MDGVIELSVFNIERELAGNARPSLEIGTGTGDESPTSTWSSLTVLEQARQDDAVALPPIDGGVQGWTFLLCSFVLETLVWGFPLRFVCSPCTSDRLSPSRKGADPVLSAATASFRNGTSATRPSRMLRRPPLMQLVPSQLRSSTAKELCCSLLPSVTHSCSGR